MKPPVFDYLRAASLDEALDTLAEQGDDATIIAGGQSLLAMLNMRLLAPQVLVDIRGIEQLDTLKISDGSVQIGAAVTQGRLARMMELGADLPLVSHALQHVGHYQTRARGTVCGSLAHADPSSELPLCLATLGGHVQLRSRDASRSVPAQAFQTGMLETACEAEEIIFAVHFPLRRENEGQAFSEFSRRHGDFAVVAAAATACGEEVRLGFGGIDDRPMVMTWPSLDDAQVDDAVNEFIASIDILEERHTPATYRARLARALGAQVIREARACRF
jgi:2-furoyl-CoA dehydrogenase FAD binding subunit